MLGVISTIILIEEYIPVCFLVLPPPVLVPAVSALSALSAAPAAAAMTAAARRRGVVPAAVPHQGSGVRHGQRRL